MKNECLRFCNLYKDKIKYDKAINEVKKDAFEDYRPRISFHITFTSVVHRFYSEGESPTLLFELDSDDLKYLYDKYSKKLKSEMDLNIKSIESDYNKILNE